MRTAGEATKIFPAGKNLPVMTHNFRPSFVISTLYVISRLDEIMFGFSLSISPTLPMFFKNKFLIALWVQRLTLHSVCNIAPREFDLLEKYFLGGNSAFGTISNYDVIKMMAVYREFSIVNTSEIFHRIGTNLFYWKIPVRTIFL